jgi:nitroalkane oxidase
MLVGAMSVSLMRAAYEAALKFSKQDTRGGAEPIIGRQSVANLLMNVKMNCGLQRMRLKVVGGRRWRLRLRYSVLRLL